ncbi:MAG: hypothetical protein U5L45_20000 [Saprospiraceae bacterium]|nr:hypothetical protein [Saprospiraceae bacterium]
MVDFSGFAQKINHLFFLRASEASVRKGLNRYLDICFRCTLQISNFFGKTNYFIVVLLDER